VPGAVLAQREEDLPQQVVAPGARLRRDVAEKEFVEHRLGAQVERRERLAPVVGHQQPLYQLAQRLPRRIGLPELLSQVAELRAQPAQQRHPVGQAVDPAHLVGRLQRAGDRDASARCHLADVRRQHLQPVIDVAQRRQQPLQRVDPCRVELVVVVAVFDRSQQTVDVGFLGVLQVHVFRIGRLARVGEAIPVVAGECRLGLMAPVPTGQRYLHLEAPADVVVQLRGRNFVVGRHPPRAGEVPVGLARFRHPSTLHPRTSTAAP
jgi:hypothetical protein